ncbi:hypothetical protein ITJ38_01280 [Agreia pratensis]|uniref:hypothetical protein n=1 Tax=Agreia pratensis TaxID=150121 RepID=UPI00188A1A37|nr:hypothetical protein [Agreia pratensis]MBF4633029.1 hypothetical protein [Agreia pratensis]
MGIELSLAVVVALAFTATVVLFTISRDRVAGIAGIAFMAAQIAVAIQNVGGNNVLKYAVLGFCLYLVIVVVLRRGSDLPRGPILILFAAYLALLLLSSLVHPDRSNLSLYSGILISGLGAALIFAVMTSAERQWAVKGIIVIASLEAVYALLELAVGLPAIWGRALTADGAIESGGYNQIVSGLVRSQGTLGNPLTLALLLLFAIGFVVRGHGPTKLGSRAIVVTLLMAGCFASGSRSALFIGFLLIIFARQNRRWKTIFAGVASLAVIVLFAAATGFFQSAIVVRFVSGSSVTHRSGALDAVPGLLSLQNPLSVLLGNGYFSAYTLFGEGLLQEGHFYAVDNQLVMTLVEGGLVTLAVLIALCAMVWIALPANRPACFALLAFFITFDVLSWPFGVALFGLIVGLGASSQKGGLRGHRTRASLASTHERRLELVNASSVAELKQSHPRGLA